jgi:two-component system chemotaxis response regulator CheY
VSLNLLIVDDSAVMRSMIAKSLRLSGIEVGDLHQSGNGLEGLRVIEENRIDLVLVDINMPVMGGPEMIEKLRARPETANLPVIVVSSDGSTGGKEMARHHAARFVHKPFTPEVLRDAIRQVMGATDDEIAGNRPVPSGGPDF